MAAIINLQLTDGGSLMLARPDRRLGEHDLTHAQWAPLFKIAHKHASTVAELARECDCDAGAMTRMLDRLEAKGWIESEWGLSDNNRRAKYYSLTPDGRAHLKSEISTWKRYAAAMVRVLEPA